MGKELSEDSRPVDYVSWNDVQEFIRKLNVKTGKNYRLPTEAEWEYAARGGNKSKGYKYSGSNDVDDVAWYDENMRGGSEGWKEPSVGMKTPNELGLYDMSGGVWEYCGDWYGEYSGEAQSDPTGPSTGSYRVFRGEGGQSRDRRVRVSVRGYDSSGVGDFAVGFRLAIGSSKTQDEPTREQWQGDGSMESSEVQQRLQSSLASVPFVGCRETWGNLSGWVVLDAPEKTRRHVFIPEEIATRLAYYETWNEYGVLAPRGWYCYLWGSNSGGRLIVSPSPVSSDSWRKDGLSGQVVSLHTVFGGGSGRFTVADMILRVFPNYKELTQRAVTEPGWDWDFDWPNGPYPHDRLVYRNPLVVEYETPANTEGLGLNHSALRKNERPVKGVVILHPTGDIYTTHLAARLESVDDDLIPYIIQLVESDDGKVLKQ
jgi:hypothetical protein